MYRLPFPRPHVRALLTPALATAVRTRSSAGDDSPTPPANLPHAENPTTGDEQVETKSPAADGAVAREAEPLVGASSAAKHEAANGEAGEPSDAAPPNITGQASGAADGAVAEVEKEPMRWVQEAYTDPDKQPIVDANGEYIVSKVVWPTGEIAYTTPRPVDDKLAPRFGYNVVQVKKHVSWWKYNQKYPRFSLAYLNIQVLFLLGLAWLVAFLTTEYRRTMESMKTPGAMVGEHRGRGPVANRTQKISFTSNEMSAMVDKAQNNWLDGSAEANYIGSKDYRMKKIPRPKEFSAEDFRKR